jgi:hypothetical protein
MPDLTVPKLLLSFWITIPCAEHLAVLIRQIWPSDFWLFGHLKGVLQGSSFDEFDEPDELLSAIEKILRGIDPETLDAGFQEWII